MHRNFSLFPGIPYPEGKRVLPNYLRQDIAASLAVLWEKQTTHRRVYDLAKATKVSTISCINLLKGRPTYEAVTAEKLQKLVVNLGGTVIIRSTIGAPAPHWTMTLETLHEARATIRISLLREQSLLA